MSIAQLPSDVGQYPSWDDPIITAFDPRISTALTRQIEFVKTCERLYLSYVQSKAYANWIDRGVSESSGHSIRKEAFQDRQIEAIREWLLCDEIVSKRQSGLTGVKLSSEVLRFCLCSNLDPEQTITLHDLGKTIDSVRECFSVIGSPVVNMVHDPEIEDVRYLVIEIQVRGGVKENVKAHREFARKMAHLLGAKRDTIRLHYDMI